VSMLESGVVGGVSWQTRTRTWNGEWFTSLRGLGRGCGRYELT